MTEQTVDTYFQRLLDRKPTISVFSDLFKHVSLTIYFYFPKVLPNVVFLNPKPLLNKLSLLISISFIDAVDHVYHSTHEKVKTRGIFSQGLLAEFLLQGFSKEFSHKIFLGLVEYLFILYPLPHSKEYSLPCVLPTSNLESLSQPFIEKVNPLVLSLNERPLPEGLFSAVVVNLLSCKCSPKFILSQADKPKYLFTYCVPV